MGKVLLKLVKVLLQEPFYGFCFLALIGGGWLLKDGGGIRLSLEVMPTKNLAVMEKTTGKIALGVGGGSEDEGSGR